MFGECLCNMFYLFEFRAYCHAPCWYAVLNVVPRMGYFQNMAQGVLFGGYVRQSMQAVFPTLAFITLSHWMSYIEIICTFLHD